MLLAAGGVHATLPSRMVFSTSFSQEYPYKEVLDLLANRCLASRTNAWTDTDHTCYTVYTAGTSGFMNILPVYMDHILFPLLREEDFMTEVHHITAKGEDSGVVYSEMQARYLSSLTYLLLRCVYRELRCLFDLCMDYT